MEGGFWRMKYFIFTAALVLVACSMPGVGELEERVDALETGTSYDDTELNGRLAALEDQLEGLEDILAMPVDYGTDSTGQAMRPAIDPAQITRLQASLADLTDSLTVLGGDIKVLGDSIMVLNTGLGEMTDSLAAVKTSLDEVTLAVDSLTIQNEELRTDLDDLEDEVASIRWANEQQMGTSGRPSGATGDRDSGGSGTTGGRDTGGGGGGGSGR